MKNRVLLLLLTVALVGGIDWVVPTTRAEAPSLQEAPAAERTVWYFYRVKWGYQDEFLDLYQTNHYPVIKAQLGGRVIDFKAYGPMYHGDGRSDWTLATVMTFRDDAALTGRHQAPPRERHPCACSRTGWRLPSSGPTTGG